MKDLSLSANLQTLAVCNTSTPADAVGVLVQAAAAILTARFSPYQIVHLLTAAFKDSVQASAVDPLAGAEPREPGRTTEAELVKFFLTRGVELRGEADGLSITFAMMRAAVVLIEDERGTAQALAIMEDLLRDWRGVEPRTPAPPPPPPSVH